MWMGEFGSGGRNGERLRRRKRQLELPWPLEKVLESSLSLGWIFGAKQFRLCCGFVEGEFNGEQRCVVVSGPNCQMKCERRE